MSNQYTERGVRGESNHWRDERLSLRHRKWGFGCPATDIDFLLVEYAKSAPAVLIEHKYITLRGSVDINNSTFKAVRALADAARIPFLLVFHSHTPHWWFAVCPINLVAIQRLPRETVMSEAEYVELLYRMRGVDLPAAVRKTLSTWKPNLQNEVR